VKAIVTGGASGIGAKVASRLQSEGYEVQVLDLATGFDVSDAEAWEEQVWEVDVACLNAGVPGGPADPAELSLDDYRRAVAVNLDGVVFGLHRLASTMSVGGQIVVTASLAGLTAMPDDPVYAATKHAVIGFVRSAAPALARRGITLNAVCPGIVDTPMLSDGLRRRLMEAHFPLLAPDDVAEAIWVALQSGATGRAWVVQPGRPALDFRFPNVPGPRDSEGERIGEAPPLTP
jgi:NAD(P)-dependent dehydrogenase (short-subunit alcohol dehydrogenase family)